MKKIILLATALFIITSAKTQIDTVKKMADLPVLNYSTASLKTGDTAAIHTWIKNLAASELKHTDSILNNYVVANLEIQVVLIRTKSLCNFIMANWQELTYADTVFRMMEPAEPAFNKAGIAEFSSYAKAMLQPGTDFNKSYLAFYNEAMQPLTEDEKEMFTANIMAKINASSSLYEAGLNKFKQNNFVSDTSIYDFLKGYVYNRFSKNIYPQLFTYINTAIKTKFTKADTLRGSITPERAWWDVLHYAITVKPDYTSKTITGKNTIRYKVISDSYPAFMQIDLHQPLQIDSVLFNSSRKLTFTKDGNVWHVAVPKQRKLSLDSVIVYYHGKVTEAANAPWDGGWVWAKDSLGNAWMSVACEGFGASVWFPCKDHLSDEPDNGASVALIVPDTLVAVSNGRLQTKQNNNDGTTTYTWAVVNPINSYDITAYIGKYVNLNEVYDGIKGKLDLNYWVMNYNVERAKAHMIPEVHRMLKAFEYWMGPYPFYEDGYKLVESSYAGMEHQSAVAYGNGYVNGWMGYDFSGSGWGMKWDYMIVHESGHEWFGNNITAKDITDMWLHEGFTMYSETLFTEYYYGKEAGNEYTVSNRSNIQNVFPVVGFYGVNDDVSLRNQDMYYKGSNLLQTIRHSIDNDSLFRNILIGLNKTFYHQTVTSAQVENYICKKVDYDYRKVFDQYIRDVRIPQLRFYFSDDKKKVFYRYSNCINGFNLPLVLKDNQEKLKITPDETWKSILVSSAQQQLFTADSIEKEYYITAKQLGGKPGNSN